jgi:hypothetical protein
MARTSSLILLVNSFTKAEKRYFKLSAALQNGNKNYLDLFELLEKKLYRKADQLKQDFKQLHPTSSFEITSKYLYSILMESLLHLKNSEQDETVKMNNALSIVKILFEKSLYLEGFSELQKLQKLAEKKKNSIIQLSAIRLELHYRNQLNFLDMTEKELIQNQMKISALIRSINNNHQHISLYELLRHRLMHKGNARTTKHKDELNDLVVSELNLMTIPSHNTFETSKIHLMFQSSYCISVGDYKSALKTFYELNELFENNEHLWKESAFDYLSCLEGILDSLHTIKRYDEIDFYIEKVARVQSDSTLLDVLKYRIIFLYRIISLTDRGFYTEALGLLNKDFEENLSSRIHILGFNKQAELYLYIALIHLGNNDTATSMKFLNKVLMDNSMYYNLPQYKTFRLIRLLVHYELSNYEFVKYEISAIKRQMHNKDKTYKLEKLIFQFIQSTYLYLNPTQRLAIWAKLKPEFEKLRTDKFEIQLLKIFDFPTWVEAKLCRRSFTELLRERSVS